MNKAAIYVSFLLLCVLGLHFHSSYGEHNKSVRLQNGLRFINMSKGEILREFSKDIVFIIKQPEIKRAYLYKIDEYASDGHWKVLKTPIGFQHGSQEHYFIEAFNGTQTYMDTIPRMKYEEIQALVYDAPKIEALKLYQDEMDDGLFSYLEDSIFIFFFLAILYFLVLLLVEIPISLIKRFLQKDFRIWIYLIIAIAVVRFLQLFLSPPTFPINGWVTWLRPIILIIPTFVLYQWFRLRKENKFEFADQQFVKFVTILIGVFISIHIADYVGLQIVSNEQRGITTAPFRLSMAFGFSFALGNLFFNISKYLYGLRGSKAQLEEAQAKVLSSDSKMDAMQSSVNPHFLYNALNSIAAIAKEDPDKTQKMSLALSEFYRYNTNREEKELSTVKDELEMIKNYLEIEKIRFEDRLQYSIEKDERSYSLKMPYFLLQPIVENAVKYGYNKINDKIEIKISFKQNNGFLDISVYDHGPKFTDSLQEGYGIRATRKKLKYLFQDDFELNFINAPEKKVFISIPAVDHTPN